MHNSSSQGQGPVPPVPATGGAQDEAARGAPQDEDVRLREKALREWHEGWVARAGSGSGSGVGGVGGVGGVSGAGGAGDVAGVGDAGDVGPWAAEAAAAVIDAVVGGAPADEAGAMWARANRDTSEMVGRLSVLRNWLALNAGTEQAKLQRSLDEVTAAAAEEALSRLERVSRTDTLTGVGNRRALDEALHAALAGASRQGHPVSVVAIDLDGLKAINDTEGHAAGDAALLALVEAVKNEVRDQDLLYRTGGDEFLLVVPFTDAPAAEALMERIAASAPLFSWGVAGYPRDALEAGALLEMADADLYRRRHVRRVGRAAPASSAGRAALASGFWPSARKPRLTTWARADEETPPRPDAILRTLQHERVAWIGAAALLLAAALVGMTIGARSPVKHVAVAPVLGSARARSTKSAPGAARASKSSGPAGATRGSAGPTAPSARNASPQSALPHIAGYQIATQSLTVAPKPTTLTTQSSQPPTTTQPTTTTTQPTTTTTQPTPPQHKPTSTVTQLVGGLLNSILKATGPLGISGPAATGHSTTSATGGSSSLQSWLMSIAS